MPEVVIVGADGTEHVFPDGFDPKRAAAIVRGDGAPEGKSLGGFLSNVGTGLVDAAKDTIDTLNPFNWDDIASSAHSARQAYNADAAGAIERVQRGEIDPAMPVGERVIGILDAAYDDPVGSALPFVPAIPAGSVVSGASQVARGTANAARATAQGARSAAASGAGFVARHPTAVSTAAGATPGIIAGSPYGAAAGAYVGFRDAPAMGRRMGRLEKRLRGPAATAPPAPKAAPAASQAPSDALLREVMARDIDWRTTDAVPIDAIKRDVSRGGSIIEAGESRIGLGERLAEALKNPTPENVDLAVKLAKALRQRMHINAKSSR